MPPRAAYNSGDAQRSMYDAEQNVVMSRPRKGGIRSWGHCETCRRITSPWDDEYIGWAEVFAGGLLNSPNAGARTGLVGVMPRARPGRFARAAVAGLTTGAESLYSTHRSFLEDIVAGRRLLGDPDLRLLAGVTPIEEHTYVGGGHGGASVTVSLGGSGSAEVVEYKRTLSAVLHFPPFSLLLVDPDTAPEYPHTDCTSWLQFAVDEVVQDFEFALPGVKIASSVVATADSFAATVV